MISEFKETRINPEIRIGKEKESLSRDEFVRMEHCPHCNGRGYFMINPFRTGGSNGAGGAANMAQCLTCLDCKEYWDRHGTLPAGYEIKGEGDV